MKVEKTEDKLTDKQKLVLEYWEGGEFNQKFIAKELQMDEAQLSKNIKWMKNKGYDRDEYKLEAQVVR